MRNESLQLLATRGPGGGGGKASQETFLGEMDMAMGLCLFYQRSVSKDLLNSLQEQDTVEGCNSLGLPPASFLNLMSLKPHNRTAQTMREQNGGRGEVSLRT